jgi:hypothetical protein
MPDDASEALVEQRWKNGSKVSLGRPGDDQAIRTAILNHMNEGTKKSVKEIRWLSPDEVISSASWYTGPVGAAWYYYVLQRGPNGWHVFTRYMLAIS